MSKETNTASKKVASAKVTAAGKVAGDKVTADKMVADAKVKKRAEGGSVLGTKSAVRLDKLARGGASPYSSAKGGESPSKQTSGKGSGHEDERPGSVD